MIKAEHVVLSKLQCLALHKLHLSTNLFRVNNTNPLFWDQYHLFSAIILNYTVCIFHTAATDFDVRERFAVGSSQDGCTWIEVIQEDAGRQRVIEAEGYKMRALLCLYSNSTSDFAQC